MQWQTAAAGKAKDNLSSDALVLFGVTGDLAHKMIFPALYAMAKPRALTVPVIGGAGPITLPPNQKTFMSSSSTPWWAEKTSWMSPARTPGTLFAAMDAPTPLPHNATPRSTLATPV